MKLDEIHDLWDGDCEIDQNNISVEASRVPKLHSKYYRIYSREGLEYQKMKERLNRLILLKDQYYRGLMAEEELEELGWPPNPKLILKADVKQHIDGDKDVIKYRLQVANQQQKIALLEDIVKSINTRNFLLKTIVDYERFRGGG